MVGCQRRGRGRCGQPHEELDQCCGDEGEERRQGDESRPCTWGLGRGPVAEWSAVVSESSVVRSYPKSVLASLEVVELDEDALWDLPQHLIGHGCWHGRFCLTVDGAQRLQPGSVLLGERSSVGA